MTTHEFNKMLPQYRGEMFRYAVFLTGSRDDALDLVQSAFLNALKYQGSFDGKNLPAWLFSILKNNFINDYRKFKNHGEFISQLSEFHNNMSSGKGDSPESCYLHGELKDIIARLRSIHRKPFQMLVDGYKYEEIARALDVNIGTIKSRIFLARKSIMDILKNDHNIHLKPQPMTNTNEGPCAQETINDVAKQCIADLLIKALSDENLKTNEAGALLDIAPAYLSMVKNKDLWNNMGASKWIIVQKWANSGLSIVKYAAANGRSISNVNPKPKVEPEVKTPAPNKDVKAPAPNKEGDKAPEPVKTDKEKLLEIENAEKIAASAKEFPSLIIIFGNGESVEEKNLSLEDAIKEVKSKESAYYYGTNGGATIFETKKVYSIENKPVETRY